MEGVPALTTGMATGVALMTVAMLGMILRRRRQACRPAWDAHAGETDHLLKLFYDLPFLGMAVICPCTQRWLHVNDRLCDILGYSREELLVMTWTQITHRDDAAGDHEFCARLVRGEVDRYRTTKRYLRKDGSVIHAAVDARGLRRTDGATDLIVATIDDISDRLEAESRLRQVECVFKSTEEAIAITDAALCFVAVNDAFTRITGYNEQEVLGKTPRLLRSGRHDREFYQVMWTAVNSAGQWSGEIWNRRKNGEIYPEALTIKAVHDNRGHVTNYVGVFSDISSMKQSQERLYYLAHHDPLTGLPNRTLFHSRLEHSLQRVRRSGGRLALLYLDLDRFKSVNDTLGHPHGDRLLQVIAGALARTLREEDTLARLGGDEFILLLEEVTGPEQAAMVANKLLSLFAKPSQVGITELYVTASIGISLYPEDGEDADTLIKNADVAMYHAKSKGRNTFQFFSAEMTDGAIDRLLLEIDLRGALERGEFSVYYQPQINLRSGKLRGAEALLRWLHPERGPVSPAQFIPVAEDIGIIGELGQWVLEQVCRQIRRWDRDGFVIPRIAVNLSMQQIEREHLVKGVRRVLEETGVAADRLELEVTESMLMRRTDVAIATLKELRALGVYLSVDDFGTGYSSLAYLKHLPLHQLKIDRSFVGNLIENTNDMAITRAVIALGHSLGLSVLAEGVEKPDQAEFLRQEGCDDAQGYFYSPPLPTADFLERWGIQKAGVPLLIPHGGE